MRYLLICTLFLVLGISCTVRKEYKDEDYKQMQQEYEQKKAELSKEKVKLFKENKEELAHLVEMADYLLDTANSFDDAPEDSTFFLEDVALVPVNFLNKTLLYSTIQNTSSAEKAKAIFLLRRKVDSTSILFNDPLATIRPCCSVGIDELCTNIDAETINKLVDVRYAFVVSEYLKTTPRIKGNEFEGGIYIGGIMVFDLKEKAPLLMFTVVATNSDEVHVYSDNDYTNQATIENDFEGNIEKAFLEECQKHFLFARG